MSKKRLIRRIKPDVHSKEHQRKLLKEIMESDERDGLYDLEKFIEDDNMVPSTEL